MKGIVAETNPGRGMVAVKTEDAYSIFEVLGDDVPEVGTEVVWASVNPLGDEEILLGPERRSMSVYFQNHHVHQSQLRSQLLFD